MKIIFYDPDDEQPKRKRRTHGSLTMDWVAELGWKRNPFDLGHVPLADMEDERQEINLFFVKKRQFGIVKGAHGMGKTTLLRWLKGELDAYKGIDPHYLDAETVPSEDSLRIVLADAYRGIFSRGKPITDDELGSLVTGKANGRYVLLLDNAQALSHAQLQTIRALLTAGACVLCASETALSGMPSDELGLVLRKRSAIDCEKILFGRIEAVGGKDITPFTPGVVRKMARDTSSISEFLELAQETAINIALRRVTLDEELPPETIAEGEEEKAEQRKGIKKHKPKDEKKRKYDELIETLTSEAEDE